METTLYEVEFKDGRRYRINCANATQKRKFADNYNKVGHLCNGVKELSNGIHTSSQWKSIVGNVLAENSK